MRLGLLPSQFGASFGVNIEMIKAAEDLGFHSVWFSEAWGNDAITPSAWTLAQTSKINVGTAIIQMQARTPSMAAMTAMTLQALSGNRFILGVGPSGPQVIEGWHGVPHGKPLMRTREYIAIIRDILERKGPLEFVGEHYEIPFKGDGATGLGKPLKSILHGDPSMKIYSASITPGGVRNSAHVADGFFPFVMIPERFDVFAEDLEAGFAKAGNGKGLKDFDVAPFVPTRMGDDLEECRQPVREQLALYIGGMGARDKNYYKDYISRLGWEGAAADIQNLFLDGKRAEAAAAVPDDLVDSVALVGPAGRIVERLDAWKDAAKKGHVTSLLIGRPNSVDDMRVIAEAVL
jgi:F420-dependent oxidoreductase-like protein